MHKLIINRFHTPHMVIRMLVISFCCLITLQSNAVFAQDGAQLFKTYCAACHTVGKGKLVGPDLSGLSISRNNDWLMKFIKSSKSMIESGDQDAVAIAKEYFNILMPDFTGTESEIASIITFIEAADGNQDQADAGNVKEIKVWAGNADTGRMYFEGTLRFKNTGASCMSCHHIGYPESLQGGLLAKDLTLSFKTLGGESSVNAMLTSPPFPAMQSAYKNNVVTAQEIAHLISYLKISSEQTKIVQATIFTDTFVVGLIITTFLFFLITVIWAKRKKDSVNKNIMNRQAR